MNDTLFLNTQTTGFNYKRDKIISIGLLYFQSDNYSIKQFFSCDGKEENLTDQFMDFMKQNEFSNLVTYNGKSFDLPFINYKIKKCGFLQGLRYNNHFDLYRELKKYNHMFGFKKLSLANIKNEWNIPYKSEISSKDINNLYDDYIINKNLSSKTSILQYSADNLKSMRIIEENLDKFKVELLIECKFLKTHVRLLNIVKHKKKADIILEFTAPYPDIPIEIYCEGINIKRKNNFLIIETDIIFGTDDNGRICTVSVLDMSNPLYIGDAKQWGRIIAFTKSLLNEI